MNDYMPIKEAAIKLDNTIFCGYCHAEAIKEAINTNLYSRDEIRKAIQGFITEDNVFVDRKIALEIARLYMQIVTKHNPQDELLSEDLYKDITEIKTRQKSLMDI